GGLYAGGRSCWRALDRPGGRADVAAEPTRGRYQRHRGRATNPEGRRCDLARGLRPRPRARRPRIRLDGRRPGRGGRAAAGGRGRWPPRRLRDAPGLGLHQRPRPLRLGAPLPPFRRRDRHLLRRGDAHRVPDRARLL
ncbi:MAG: Probable transmembrane protein, partial [uncultured Rubrobacteraceae bacterium]